MLLVSRITTTNKVFQVKLIIRKTVSNGFAGDKNDSDMGSNWQSRDHAGTEKENHIFVRE